MLQGFQVKSSFWLKPTVAVALVGLGDLLFYQWQQFGANIGYFGLAIVAAMLISRHAIRLERRAWVALVAATLFGCAMVWDANLLAWALFCVAAAMAALLPASARFSDGWRWFQRLVLHGIRAPFAPLIDLVRLQRVRRRRPQARFGLRTSLSTLALPAMGGFIFLALFAAANPIIERALNALAMPSLSPWTILRMVIWTTLFIFVWSFLHPRMARRVLSTFDGTGDLKLPGVSVTSVRLSLILFNLLFALQNILDIAYLGGMAPMPEGITLAQYAHRGAYPLIVTALLAALFVVVTLRPGSTTAAVPLIRRLVALWIGQNIVLVASSIIRTLDYVEAYSLTVLRISALAWMVLVAVGLMLICWRLFANKSVGWLINANLAAAGLLLTVASVVDLGAVAASWNVRHAREVGGSGAALDLCYLDNLGGSSLLSLIELEQRGTLNAEFRTRVHAVRERVFVRLREEQEFAPTLLSRRRLERAEAEASTLKETPIPPGARGCNGALIPPTPAPSAAPTADTGPSGPVTAASPSAALTARPLQ